MSRLGLIIIFVALTVLPSLLIAGEPEKPLPSRELLEFLADWETENGDWLDPEELEKMELPEWEQENEAR